MSRMGDSYIDELNAEPAPLEQWYLQEAEHRARRHQGAWTGTSGSLAADVLRLLAEVKRLRVEMARRQELRRLMPPLDG